MTGDFNADGFPFDIFVVNYGASSEALVASGWPALMFPLVISGAGIVVCLLT